MELQYPQTQQPIGLIQVAQILNHKNFFTLFY
jgi:hypothetical protein